MVHGMVYKLTTDSRKNRRAPLFKKGSLIILYDSKAFIFKLRLERCWLFGEVGGVLPE